MSNAPQNVPLSVSIGQIPLTLFFRENGLLEKASARYSAFHYASEQGFPVYLDPEKDFRPGAGFDFSLHGATLRLEPSAARISGVQSEYTVDSLLRVLLSMILLPRRGFLLHAATVEREGQAHIFMGHSGAGKSTVAGLSPAGAPLTDEISLLRCEAGGWRAHGTPFWGEFRSGDRNCSLPVAGIYALVQAPENRLEKISPREALRGLLANVLFFAGNRASREQLLGIASECAQALPFYRFHFKRDSSFWEVLP
ncbi:MAG: hypothetical protein HY234_12225 [Acidobacteria bacterium]|nr:hypothetical protein [Acidobacteriota bacterium]